MKWLGGLVVFSIRCLAVVRKPQQHQLTDDDSTV